MDAGSDGWSIEGSECLRTADPAEAGELKLKFVGASAELFGDDDEKWEIEFVAE